MGEKTVRVFTATIEGVIPDHLSEKDAKVMVMQGMSFNAFLSPQIGLIAIEEQPVPAAELEARWKQEQWKAAKAKRKIANG